MNLDIIIRYQLKRKLSCDNS